MIKGYYMISCRIKPLVSCLSVSLALLFSLQSSADLLVTSSPYPISPTNIDLVTVDERFNEPLTTFNGPILDGIVEPITSTQPSPNSVTSNTWVLCATEGSNCIPPVPALVRYGANGIYVFQQTSGTIRCNISSFGNPATYASRHCDYQLSSTADFDGDGVVDILDTFPSNAAESTDSDNDGLGDNNDPFPQDATNRATSNWVRCANQWANCIPPVPALVRYGTNGVYAFQQANGTIRCSNSTFGNPATYTFKYCDYLLSSSADYDGDGVVDSLDAFPSNPAESADSDNDGLGDNNDPFPQDATNSTASDWVRCANEWSNCTPPIPALVRYGANDAYFFQQTNGTIRCNNSTFGNPATYVFKHCDYLLSSTADYDGDGVVDSLDAFPDNATESVDSDNDGLGDNSDPFPQDSSNSVSSNWIHCANEGSNCIPPTAALVRYGANGSYFYRKTNHETIRCNINSFGDPARYVSKKCSYIPWVIDTDNDSIADNVDNCPNDANTDQSDIDNDAIGDVCDLINNKPTWGNFSWGEATWQ
jgi:hypothetical protein